MESLEMSKKELLNFLNERLDYFINEEQNPFIESKMVSYINNGIKKINAINCTDNQMLKMYDINDEIVVEMLWNKTKSIKVVDIPPQYKIGGKKMDLKGKMDLYISYSFGNIKFDEIIKNEKQLKNFINELIELKKEDINV